MLSEPGPSGARAMIELPDALADPFIGQRINSLVVKLRLASGGMGVVYLAEHERSPNIKRVIKLLLPEYARVPAIRQRFVREAEAAARLAHDSIIKIEDYGTLPDGQCYLVMDYLHGETLDDYLQRHPRFDPHRACLLLAQICSALQHAHAHGIVHRDLKPSNIFLIRVKSAIRVVLLDFGIAKDTGARDALVTDTGMVLGTPAYMAVEQFEDASRVSPASDVYALAIIAWQMLAGELPWGMHNAPVLYRKQMNERPQAPPESVMSRDLAKVLYAALAVDPVARPQSMRAFAVAFASAIPAIPPDLPSGAEILGAVASDLVIEAPHHELTLRNIASQDRLGALLWSHREPGTPVPRDVELPSSGVPHEVPVPDGVPVAGPPLPALRPDRAPAAAAGPPTPVLRARRAGSAGSATPLLPPLAAAVPAAAAAAPAPAIHRPSSRRLGLLAIGSALLVGLATFALVRFTKEGDSTAATVKPGSAELAVADAPDAGAIVAQIAVDAAVAPPIDAQLATPPPPRPPIAAPPVTPPPPPPPTPKPTPKPPIVRATEAAPRPGEHQTGDLVIRVQTWAEVWVDGSHKGQAPLRVTVPAGRRTVLLVNDDHRETVPITVIANRDAIIERSW